MTYKEMTKETKGRRAAAACFFELLQLKTLDFIKVKQDEPFQDIQVSKGLRFMNYVPALDG